MEESNNENGFLNRKHGVNAVDHVIILPVVLLCEISLLIWVNGINLHLILWDAVQINSTIRLLSLKVHFKQKLNKQKRNPNEFIRVLFLLLRCLYAINPLHYFEWESSTYVLRSAHRRGCGRGDLGGEASWKRISSGEPCYRRQWKARDCPE